MRPNTDEFGLPVPAPRRDASQTVSYANNTNAGTATASATYAGDTNHESSGDSKTFYIAKAASSTVVSVPGGQAFTYDGLEHPATVSVTGAGGLVWAPSPVYGCGHVPKDVADSDCIASYTYAGDANHNGSSGSITYAIAKAPSITTVLAANVFYDGNQHGATAATTGAGALNLSLVVTYSGVNGTTYGPSPTMPKELGTYQAAASFVGDPNHTVSAGTTTFSIVGVTVTGPGGPLAKGTTASLVVSIPNTGMNTAPKCSVDWDDGTSTPPTTMTLNSGQGACTLPKPYPAAGVYSPVVRVDADLNNAGTTTSITTVYQFVVIYDTSAGFVTGGGWIISPPGAYVGNPALTGKANFGFVSKYQKGANVPTGDTEFQFQAGGFNFKSTVYEWLVISGSKAQYKGSGTVNGSDDYGFLLTATDGKLKGDGIDKFRIKVWSKSTGDVVYDNKPGSDDIDTSGQTELGGGSIVIHK